MSALKKDPSSKAQAAPFDPARAQARINYLKQVRPNDPQIAALQAKIGANPAPIDPGGQLPPQNNALDQVNAGADAQMQHQFDYMNQRGDFNPGDFADTQQKAYDSVYNQWDRNTSQAFDKQQKDFQQMAAERGLDPNSEGYKTMYQQMMGSQNTARLNTQDQAYTQGLNAQGQAFGQAASTYQMPYQNLAAMNPMYAGQQNAAMQQGQQAWQGQQQAGQNAFTAGQNALDRSYNKWALNQQLAHRGGGGGGGGGGLTLQDQMQLQNNAFYNNLALLGYQNGLGGGGQQPSAGNSILQGVGAGVTAAIGGGLVR